MTRAEQVLAAAIAIIAAEPSVLCQPADRQRVTVRNAFELAELVMAEAERRGWVQGIDHE